MKLDAALVHLLRDDPTSEEMAPPRSGGAGPAGNARLTAVAGVVLLIPLGLVFGSGLLFDSLRSVHFFVGFLLIPLVGVKLGSTAWRVVRYYVVDRGDGAYRRIGPPWWLPRLLGPAVAASGVLVVLSGVVLWVQRTQRGAWSTVHTTSAVVFGITLGLHLLLRAWRTVREAGAELGAVRAPKLSGRALRHALLALALVIGLALGAVLTARTDWPQQPQRHADIGRGGG
ncbi:MAG TPA: hypothetical protein VI316_05475 [Candidatus Dormibacteraeota bacterium]